MPVRVFVMVMVTGVHYTITTFKGSVYHFARVVVSLQQVLNITDATQVTFRMFAVITALCERVSSME